MFTHTGANSGVYFHTAWVDKGWPTQQGFEMQVNNHQPVFPGDSGATYIENKKTGSLYGIRNAYKALARDNEWFTLKLRVQGPRVRIHVNDTLVVDYLEPEGAVAGLTPPLQKIGKGTFALQCHDGRSQVQYRRIAVHPLPPAPAGRRRPARRTRLRPSAKRYRLARDNFPLVDLRALDVKDVRPLEAALAAARAAARCSSASPRPARARTRAIAGRCQRRSRWRAASPASRCSSACAPTTAAGPRRSRRRRWRRSTSCCWTARRWPRRCRRPRRRPIRRPTATPWSPRRCPRSRSEPVDVYGAPFFLPAARAAQRDAIWTEARQQQVLDAAVANHVAIEINGALQLPGEAFVRKAKAAGARFTLGRCAVDTPAGDYCFGIREAVGLSWRDMYEPGHQPTAARRQADELNPQRLRSGCRRLRSRRGGD